MRSQTRKNEDPAYKAWIRTQPCVVCVAHALYLFLKRGRPSEAHHAGQRGLSQKADDRTCIPLCWTHHDRRSPHSVHSLGKNFWTFYRLNRSEIIEEMNRRYEFERETEQPKAA
jgi:hypothetical protein